MNKIKMYKLSMTLAWICAIAVALFGYLAYNVITGSYWSSCADKIATILCACALIMFGSAFGLVLTMNEEERKELRGF